MLSSLYVQCVPVGCSNFSNRFLQCYFNHYKISIQWKVKSSNTSVRTHLTVLKKTKINHTHNCATKARDHYKQHVAYTDKNQQATRW